MVKDCLSMGKRQLLSPVFFLTFVFILQASVLAQTASLEGVIRDPQDAVVPGAELLLTSTATSWSRTTLTNDEGRFTFVQLPPGEYQLKAELPGFKAITVEKLRLLVDTPTSLDLKFEMGEVSETIVVTGEQL